MENLRGLVHENFVETLYHFKLLVEVRLADRSPFSRLDVPTALAFMISIDD